MAEFRARGITILAVSTDFEEDAVKMQSGQGLEMPIGYGLDPEEVSRLTGAFYDAEDEEPYLHAAGFLLDETGKVKTAVYSTGSVGRLTAEDALRQTRDLKKE